jgi:hypothetical protein
MLSRQTQHDPKPTPTVRSRLVVLLPRVSLLAISDTSYASSGAASYTLRGAREILDHPTSSKSIPLECSSTVIQTDPLRLV